MLLNKKKERTCVYTSDLFIFWRKKSFIHTIALLFILIFFSYEKYFYSLYLSLIFVGFMQCIKSHWQIFGSAVSAVQRTHKRCSDTTSTRYSCLHISWWSLIIWGNIFISSCCYYRKDQTTIYGRWCGEYSFHLV